MLYRQWALVLGLRFVIGLGWSNAISIMDCKIHSYTFRELLLMRGKVIRILCLQL